MEKKLKVLMIGAHPDDCDIEGGGIALKYARAGHSVRFLSACNGCGGHHEMKPEDLAARRYIETQKVAALAKIEYDVWEIPDCEVIASLENRKRMISYIRNYNPDIIFTHRTNDYHADHRNTAMLVQDSAYLLIVPNLCPDAPAMRTMPVIMHFRDGFKNPVFKPDVVIDIDDVIDDKFEVYNCHVSQFYEWLPYTYGKEHLVPRDESKRLEWLHAPRISREVPMSFEELDAIDCGSHHSESKEARWASKYREKLVERYGERGKSVIFAEAFECSEYGTQLNADNVKTLFPF